MRNRPYSFDVEADSSGQHKINRQQHNSTYTIPSRLNFMLFYAFEMAVAIAFLYENAVEAI